MGNSARKKKGCIAKITQIGLKITLELEHLKNKRHCS